MLKTLIFFDIKWQIPNILRKGIFLFFLFFVFSLTPVLLFSQFIHSFSFPFLFSPSLLFSYSDWASNLFIRRVRLFTLRRSSPRFSSTLSSVFSLFETSSTSWAINISNILMMGVRILSPPSRTEISTILYSDILMDFYQSRIV